MLVAEDAAEDTIRVSFRKKRTYYVYYIRNIIGTNFGSNFASMLPRRSMATAARATSYPFSKTAIVHPEPLAEPPPALRLGKGLMPHLYKTLPTAEKQTMLQTLFSRHSKDRINVGSVVSVTTEHAPGVFNGVLLAIRRRGPDTSFVVRNIIQRTGVEIQFFVNSPHLKEIKVLKKPPNGRMRRAKLFYLRDSPEKMSLIAGAAKKS